LFETISGNSTAGLSEKYRMMFSAFEPEPDAKRAIFVLI